MSLNCLLWISIACRYSLQANQTQLWYTISTHFFEGDTGYSFLYQMHSNTALHSITFIHIETDRLFFFLNEFLFFFNFLSHNSHDKFDRQIIVSNQINQIESWRKHRCFAWVQKRVCGHQGFHSRPRTWHSFPMIRAKCDTTQLFRYPIIF